MALVPLQQVMRRPIMTSCFHSQGQTTSHLLSCSPPVFRAKISSEWSRLIFGIGIFLGVLCVIRSIPGTLQTCQLSISLCQHTNYISGLLFVVCLGTLARTRVHFGQTHYSII